MMIIIFCHFREALEKNDNKCTHINFRCAKGLYFLPGQFKDVPKALELIEQTLERAPTNVYGNSVAATIYFTLQQVNCIFLLKIIYLYTCQNSCCPHLPILFGFIR